MSTRIENDAVNGLPNAGDRLESGHAHFANADYQAALACYLPLLQHSPHEPEYHFRVGITLFRLDRNDMALEHLHAAEGLRGDHAPTHEWLGRAYFAEGKVERAETHVRRAMALAPEDREISVSLAWLLEANRQGEEAWKIVDRLLRCGHESSRFAILYATMASRVRGEREALKLINRVVQGSAPLTARERCSLHFAAASLLDKLGLYNDAFREASIANSLRNVRYDPVKVERPIREYLRYFDRPTLRRLPRATHGSEVPVFIVGMARSGTTLIEQILSSHPEVHGAGELDWIFRLCEMVMLHKPASAGVLTASIDLLTPRDADDLAEEYLRPLQALNPQALRVVDKMHTNFLHLGLIQILFPTAKVIHCRRDPQDTCLSCFMTDFAAGNDFSYSLPSLGHFHRQYTSMMAHWKNVLDLPILDLDYEQVVGDMEGQSRRLIEFVGLPWSDQCLRFHENQRFVTTASNQQVRRPIYRTSIGRWRNYDHHLAPLREALKGA